MKPPTKVKSELEGRTTCSECKEKLLGNQTKHLVTPNHFSEIDGRYSFSSASETMTKFLLSLVILFAPPILIAQPYSRQVETIPVEINGQPVKLPFAGGVNSPNNQFVDIDADGDYDLFVLDVDVPVEFYRNEGSSFSPNFRLRNGLITLPQISRWFLFYDIDGDGLKDLLAEDSTISGVRIFKNTGTPQVPLFTLLTPVLHDSSGAPVFAGQNCIPALVDIDADGDLDFISSNYSGTVNFYENAGSSTNFSLILRTTFWQRITIYGDTCTTSSVGINAHGASSYRFADINGDGAPDMFVGDLFSYGIFFLQNTGSPNSPHMSCNTGHFPANQPVITNGFNHPTFVDIDGDGDLDMFVGVLASLQQRDGFLFYKNIGTATSPLLSLQTKNFLSMIDVGMNAHPTFVDIDADGKQDMFVGNLNGQLSYFKNIGTASSPSFRLVDSTYQNITGGFSYSPAFVDIDNDGKKDLFIGMYNGRIKFYHNVGTAQAAIFVPEASPVDTISLSGPAAPVFTDIDGDGDADLFIGKSDGRINFYRNNGTPNSFQPALISTSYQNIVAGQNAFPTFTDIDGDGDFDLFIGTGEGRVEFYENIGSRTSAQFTRRTNHYANTDAMLESAPAFVDIDNDGDNDIFIGTQRGGVHFYRNQLITSSIEESEVPTTTILMQNYPNPFNPISKLRFRIQNSGITSLKVFNVLGEEVATVVNRELSAGSYEMDFNAASLASGVYIYQLRTVDVLLAKKMLVVR